MKNVDDIKKMNNRHCLKHVFEIIRLYWPWLGLRRLKSIARSIPIELNAYNILHEYFYTSSSIVYRNKNKIVKHYFCVLGMKRYMLVNTICRICTYSLASDSQCTDENIFKKFAKNRIFIWNTLSALFLYVCVFF